LRSFGYTDISFLSKGAKQTIVYDDENEDSQKVLPRPDFSQMIPFKPKANTHSGEHQMGELKTDIALVQKLMIYFP
jgi:cleavage stimulation factor subunit 3